MKRRGIREQLFKLLFRVEFNTPEQMPEQTKLYFDSGDLTVTEQDQAYLEARLTDIMDRLPQIDEQLSNKIEGWKLTRVGKVELALLRIAVYEILYDDEVPTGVAISEAVELSKKYGPDNAASFVNGVLAKFA